MKNVLFSVGFLLLTFSTFSQKDSGLDNGGPGVRGTLINDLKKDTWQDLDTVKAPPNYENIYNRPLYTDSSLVSSFIIFVKKEVKEHKHASHAEHVFVLDGEAEMTMAGKIFKIKKGDMIFIPKDTWHAVKTTSKVPLKVISIQAPGFDGNDRIMK